MRGCVAGVLCAGFFLLQLTACAVPVKSQPLPVSVDAQRSTALDEPEPDFSLDSEAWLPVPTDPSDPDNCTDTASLVLCTQVAQLSARIEFVGASPVLTPESKTHLAALIPRMRAEGIQLSVMTHLSRDDNSLLEILLAKRRTLAVIRFIAERGIPQARMRPREPTLQPELKNTNADGVRRLVELSVVPQ